MVKRSAEWQDLMLIVEEEVAKVTEHSEVALDFEKLLVNIKARLENAKILPLSVSMLRAIYKDLERTYSVSKLEVGEDKRTELLLKELKEILTEADESFLKENSLYSIASKPWHGGQILVVLKNGRRIQTEDLKQVFFAVSDGGFTTKDLAYDTFTAGENKFTIFYSKSFEVALQAVSELRQKEDSPIMASYWKRIGKALENWRQEAA